MRFFDRQQTRAAQKAAAEAARVSSEIRIHIFVSRGDSPTLRVGDQDMWNVLRETRHGSALVDTSILASFSGTDDGYQSAISFADEWEKENVHTG